MRGLWRRGVQAADLFELLLLRERGAYTGWLARIRIRVGYCCGI